MKTLKNVLRLVRSRVMKLVYPKETYFLFKVRTIEPLSTKHGFDRGTPVDRFYIESFLADNAKDIRGVCLEIGNRDYTLRFGEKRVTKSDVLDIDTKNKNANIHGDLRKLSHVSSNTYDCIILTHTLGIIDDHESAAREALRILKQGGTLLVTVSALGVAQNPEGCFWRYTPVALKYLFGKYVSSEHITVSSYGNVLAGQAFWVGLSAEELTKKELAHNDARYAVIATAIIKK